MGSNTHKQLSSVCLIFSFGTFPTSWCVSSSTSLLLLIDTHFGHEVALQVASYADSIDSHPLLVSIGSRGDRFEIRNIIEDTTSPDRVFETLVDMNINFYADIYPMDRSLHPLWYRISDSMIGGSLENLTKQLHAFIGHLIDIKDGENNIVPFPGVLSVAKPTGTYLMVGCSHTLAQGLMKDGFPRSKPMNTKTPHARTLHLSRYRTCCQSALYSTVDFVTDWKISCAHLSRRLGPCEYGNRFCDVWLGRNGPKYVSGSAILQCFPAVSDLIQRLVGDGSHDCNRILISFLLLYGNQ